MAAGPRPTRPNADLSTWFLVGSALLVTLTLATVGAFAAGFGVLTKCTNTYRCTVTRCDPCAVAYMWLTAAWALEAVLLLVALALVVLVTARRCEPLVRQLAAALVLLAPGALVFAVWAAERTF